MKTNPWNNFSPSSVWFFWFLVHLHLRFLPINPKKKEDKESHDELKEEALNDVKTFLKKQDLYEKYGIPYKRNYLLEGIPGCGKTTLILTIASELEMDVAIVNFGPKISDSVFMNAVSNLQKGTILVLEDIDSLFLKRESTRENKSAVSFSGVLNILDGLCSMMM